MMRCFGLIAPAVSVALPAMAGTAPPAMTQLPCGSRTEIIEILTTTYGEREVAHGLANTGALAQVFVGPDGTWTIVATSPNGVSCLIGAGHDWERTTTKASTGGYEEGI